MAKKISKPPFIAFVYYVLANLVMLVPSFLATLVIMIFLGHSIAALILIVAAHGLLYFYILRYSAKNICKTYIIQDVTQIRAWTLGYLIGINGILIYMRYNQYSDANTRLLALLIIIVYAVIIYHYTPHFVSLSTAEEVAEVSSQNQKTQG